MKKNTRKHRDFRAFHMADGTRRLPLESKAVDDLAIHNTAPEHLHRSHVIDVEAGGVLWTHGHARGSDQIRENIDVAGLLRRDDSVDGPPHVGDGAHVLARGGVADGVRDFVQNLKGLFACALVSLEGESARKRCRGDGFALIMSLAWRPISRRLCAPRRSSPPKEMTKFVPSPTSSSCKITFKKVMQKTMKLCESYLSFRCHDEDFSGWVLDFEFFDDGSSVTCDVDLLVLVNHHLWER